MTEEVEVRAGGKGRPKRWAGQGKGEGDAGDNGRDAEKTGMGRRKGCGGGRHGARSRMGED